MRKNLVFKIIAIAVVISFISTSAPMGAYANFSRADKLRTRAEVMKDGGKELQNELLKYADEGASTFSKLWVLINSFGLRVGKATGFYNYPNALDDKADGAVINHSEERAVIEGKMRPILDSISGLLNRERLLKTKVSYEEMKAKWVKVLELEGVSGEDIEITLPWLKEYIDYYNDKVAISLDTDEAKKQWQEEYDLYTERLSRKLTNQIEHVKLRTAVEKSKEYYKKYGIIPTKQIVICVGETEEQRKRGKETADQILKEDATEIIFGFKPKSDIDSADLRLFGVRIANEARWLIGKKGVDIPQWMLELADETNGLLKDTLRPILGWEIDTDYGAGTDKDIMPKLVGLKNVNGFLIGAAGKKVDDLRPIIKIASEYGKAHNKFFNIGVNWKAENEDTGLDPLEKFVNMFRNEDLTNLRVVISTNRVGDVKREMTKINEYLTRTSPAFWLSELYYPAVVDAKQTEVIGGGYTKEILTYESKAGEFIHPKLESLFKDEPKDGDVYVFLKKDGKIFALGRENKKDQTLTTVSTVDLSDNVAKTEYYSMLFEFTSKMTQKTGEFIELVEQDGDRLRRFISRESEPKPLDSNPMVAAFTEDFSLGNRIKGIKYWSGDEENFPQKFFQMEYRSNNAPSGTRSTLITFKQSPRKISRGLSLIVQPKNDVFINGAGTVGYEVAEALRKTGFFVKGISVGTLNEKARDAYLNKGYTLYFYSTKDQKKFEDEKINVVGNLEDVLKIVDLVVDGSPEEGVENKKIYAKFPHLKVIYQGGEEKDIADSGNSFSSATNYNENVGQKDTRVVSCNTTGLSRTAAQVAKVFKNMIINAYLQRRGTDPNSSKGGPIDATVIDTKKPSHHAPDARTVLTEEINKNIKVYNSYASKNPTTHFHVHHVYLRGEGLNAEKVKEILKVQSRVGLVEFKKEFDTSNIFQLFTNYLKRPQSYMAVAFVFADNPELPGEVDILLAVDQQTIVVPENPNAAQALLGLSKDENPAIRLVDEAMGINVIKKRIEKIAPVKLTKKPSAPKAEVKLPIDVFTESDVTIPATVLIRDDLNSSKDEEGKIKRGSKLDNAADVYNKDAEKDNKVVGLSHQGRLKDGQPDKDYTAELEQHAKIMSKLLGKIITYVNDLFGDKAVNAIKNMLPGQIIQLKNARSWEIETDEKMTPEEHSKTPLIQYLKKIIGYVKFTNLAILHRKNVSIDGWPEDMPIVLGDKVIKDIINIENVRQILMKSQPCLFLAGGAKIDDYLVLIDKGLENNLFAEVKAGGLLGELCLLAQGYQLGKPTMKILEKQFKKFESEKEGYGTGLYAMIKEVKDLLGKYPGKIDVPIDVAFIDKNGERKVVTIEKKHETEAITDEYEIRDIGDATADKYAQDIRNAKGVLIKGPLGDVVKKETAVGSQKAYSAVEEKQRIDPEFNSVLGGGDAGAAFDTLKISKDKFTVVVDAGGALIVYLAEGPNGLPGLVAAQKSKQYILQKAKASSMEPGVLLNIIIGEKTISNAQGVDILRSYVDSLLLLQGIKLEGKLLIVTPGFFESGGGITAIRELSRLGFTIGLYGDTVKTKRLQVLIGTGNIITSNSLDVLLKNFEPANALLLKAPQEKLKDDDEVILAAIKIRQIISSGIPNLDVAKSSKELGVSIADAEFKNFLKIMVAERVIEVTDDARQKLLAKLEEGQPPLEFSENDVKVTDRITNDVGVAKAKEVIKNFI